MGKGKVALAMSFGRRVRALREALSYTREELAERVGTSPQTIAKIEAGDRFITARSLERLASALGRAPQDLFDFGAKSEPKRPSRTKLLMLLDDKSERMLTLAHDLLSRVFREFDS